MSETYDYDLYDYLNVEEEEDEDIDLKRDVHNEIGEADESD